MARPINLLTDTAIRNIKTVENPSVSIQYFMGASLSWVGWRPPAAGIGP
jgi:hypothetical protein